MLVKCPECLKDVSSEAVGCPHCGFPIKSKGKDKEVPVVREDNPRKASLGTFFVVLSIIGLVGGSITLQKSELEKLQENLVYLSHNSARTAESVDNLNSSLGYGHDRYTVQDAQARVTSAESELQNIRSSRFIKSACWFVPAAILFILGLVLRASARPFESSAPSWQPLERGQTRGSDIAQITRNREFERMKSEQNDLKYFKTLLFIFLGIILFVGSIIASFFYFNSHR
jgi:DNA-directed RNA polymerase subunit RPC12/RpoP